MTSGNYKNIHPGLSQAAALEILSLPLDQLDSASDYYMAVSHLLNFPGYETECALMKLIENNYDELPLVHAQRKAVEVLALLGVKKAILSIGQLLNSTDPYLVENAAWALGVLGCQDMNIHSILLNHISNSDQNQRVIIKSVVSLGLTESLPILTDLCQHADAGIRGAALAGITKITGNMATVAKLEDHFLLPNQMDRQMAIQDSIDCGASFLLPTIIKSPVSPVFRLRAIRSLWASSEATCMGLDLINVLDTTLLDCPKDLILVHRYDTLPIIEFLIQEFYGTDFSRSYLALKTLALYPSDEIWPILLTSWRNDGHNDYGAHYFFIHLIRSTPIWPKIAIPKIILILQEAVMNLRPQFSKSRFAACLGLFKFNPDLWINLFSKGNLEGLFQSWELRYGVLFCLLNSQIRDETLSNLPEHVCEQKDSDIFVEAKRQQLISANLVLKDPYLAQ